MLHLSPCPLSSGEGVLHISRGAGAPLGLLRFCQKTPGGDIIAASVLKIIFKNRVFWAWTLLVAAAAGLSLAAGRYDYFPLDLELALRLQAFQAGWFRDFMGAVSFVSGSWRFGLAVLLTGILLWKWASLNHAAAALAAGMLSYGNVLMKLVVGRPRPAAELVAITALYSGSSFPSGHTFSSSMLLGMLAIFVLLSTARRPEKAAAVSVLAGLALLVGVSRVYLGAHWPSDVLGAYLWAGVWLVPLYYGLRRRLAASDVSGVGERQRAGRG